MSSIFTKIIKGKLPSYRIDETDDCFAFLDINPNQKGHTLCVLKKEIDLSTSLYSLLNISISLTLFRSFLSIKIIRQSEIAESPVNRASTFVIISKADDPYDIPVIENINKKIKPAYNRVDFSNKKYTF